MRGLILRLKGQGVRKNRKLVYLKGGQVCFEEDREVSDA